jgi:amidase
MGQSKFTIKPILFAAAFLGAAVTQGCNTAPTTSNDETQTAVSPSYQPSDMLSKTLPEIAAALRAGRITSEELTQLYLDRIEAIDRAGPRLQSVLALNPDALAQARAADAQRGAGETLGLLHGVPILLKDNIESRDNLATTTGALALKDNITGRDAPLTAELREAGAIILGKTNLSQWANFRSGNSNSGWSALGGQTRNPHSLDRNPCGSSSGSGSAIAASLAAGAVGTETNGSIICPSNVNGIVGFKPTVGLVSQEGIIPISATQDTAGPMTKSVRGAAIMLAALDNVDVDYSAQLDAQSLTGTRIGVARFAQGSNALITEKFDAAINVLKAQGAEIIEIEEFDRGVKNYGRKSRAVLEYEFKDGLNKYLAATPAIVKTRTLEELIAFNKNNADVELALFDQSIFESSQARGPLTEPDYISARDEIVLATGKNGIDRLLSEHNVEIIISPSGPLAPRFDPVNGDVWPAWAGAGALAAVAGYPHLSVPMGTVRNIPIGLSFIGSAGEDAKVLSFGYAYEQASGLRTEPKYLKTVEDDPKIFEALSNKLNAN